MGAIRNKLSGDTINGSLVPEVVVTDTEVVKEGSIYTPRFNGSTSKIDCGGYHDLTGDITVLVWMKPRDNTEVNYQRLFDNGELLLYRSKLGTIWASNDGDSTYKAGVNGATYNKHDWYFLSLIRKSSGLITHYVNGKISSTEDQDAGTPTSGLDIYIGDRSLGGREFDGDISEVRILSGLLSPEIINQYYTSTKHLYNK